MRELTVHDAAEIRELLGSYAFMMYNRVNNHSGELTVLTPQDVEHILEDMNHILPHLNARVYLYRPGQVEVVYPNNVCTLKSIDPEGGKQDVN